MKTDCLSAPVTDLNATMAAWDRAYLPALPTLSVLRSGENVTVSWPAVDTAGFGLEQGSPLTGPAGWVMHSAAVTDNGASRSVTLPATNSGRLFRLRRP
jgi:hypothetical protein